TEMRLSLRMKFQCTSRYPTGQVGVGIELARAKSHPPGRVASGVRVREALAFAELAQQKCAPARAVRLHEACRLFREAWVHSGQFASVFDDFAITHTMDTGAEFPAG